MDNWQPIETAPKDGTEIIITGFDSDDITLEEVLVVNASWGEISICTGGPQQYGWVTGWIKDEYNTRRELEKPTHWMPYVKPTTPPMEAPRG